MVYGTVSGSSSPNNEEAWYFEVDSGKHLFLLMFNESFEGPVSSSLTHYRHMHRHFFETPCGAPWKL
jgi:hypothetical protein